jgi:sugar (pentulose or hexulose) kinase
MSHGLLIGLDVGTTTSKAVAFTPEGQAVATGRTATPWQVSGDRVQLDPVRLAEAAVSAVAQIAEARPGEEILGIGIASMGESGVLLDSKRSPVAPTIAWHDRRDSAELEKLRAAIGPAVFSRLTGLPFGQQWSLTKHRWLLDHEAGTATATLRLNIAEWVAFKLGAAPVAEQSLASRTGWLDLERRDWSEELLAWSGASAGMMPELVTAGTRIGRVGAGSSLSAMAGAAITIAGHDHQAAAVGAGAISAGDEVDSCGTADALVRTINPGLDGGLVTQLTEAGVTVGWHALKDRWCLLGATQGGLVLQRALAALGVDRSAFPALDRAAAAADGGKVTASISDGAVLALAGIQDGVAPPHMWRAAVDETVEQLATIHEAMSSLSGAHRNFIVTGGWARSETVLTAKGRRFGNLHQPEVEEAGARGAALFAGMAAGLWTDAAEAGWHKN